MTAERREKLDIVFELNTTSDIHALQVVIETSKFFAFCGAGQSNQWLASEARRPRAWAAAAPQALQLLRCAASESPP